MRPYISACRWPVRRKEEQRFMGDVMELQKPLSATLARGLGALEMEILDIVWELNRVTSRDVFERMRDRRRLGQSTVLTVLRRLSNRGILKREAGGDVYVYSPNVGREALGGQMIDNVIRLVYRGDTQPAMAYLTAKKAN